ncbi:MAG: hypothetical protein Q7S57_05270 [bacterium]|nr:hypothetical protein [bacterium]
MTYKSVVLIGSVVSILVIGIISVLLTSQIKNNRTIKPTPFTEKPKIESISKVETLLNQQIVIYGSNFDTGNDVDSIYFGKENEISSIIDGYSVDGKTIKFDPCDNRSESDCIRLEKSLYPQFKIYIKRSSDNKFSNELLYSID